MSAPQRVGIVPAHEYHARPRLWRALEEAYPVRFEGREASALGKLDAAVAVGAELQASGLPCLLASSGEEGPDTASESEAGTSPATSLPAELGEGEALRERLRPGRYRALLALARFLRELTADGPAPPLHAAFVIDDPNLRRAR